MSENNATDIDKVWLKRIRNLIGVLGMILPWIALAGVGIVARSVTYSKEFWETFSISATYYITPPLTGILTAAAIVLMCYKGYKWYDNLITTLSGIFGIMIVIFPCKCPIAPETVGFFQLPVATSHIIHCVSAVMFFVLLAVNSMFLFTLTDKMKSQASNKGDEMTKEKKIRNIIYRVCAVGMIAALVLMVIPVDFRAKTFIVEAIALTFFGTSWLVKGQIFGLLADKEK